MMLKRLLLILSLLFIATNCGSIGTGVGNPPTPSTKTAAALAGLFSSNSDGSVSAALQTAIANRQVIAEFCNNLTDSPSQVTNSAFTDVGTYGSAEHAITVAEEDFCTLPDGTTNTGSGPDGVGVFGAFAINTDVQAECTTPEGTITVTMNTGSAGIFRNTDATTDAPAYFPQIYGNFSLSVDGTEASADCTMFLLEDQSIDFASCTDASGVAIEQDSDVTCQVLTN